MSTNDTRAELARARRIVVKVGSALLADRDVGLAVDKIRDYCAQLYALRARGIEVVLVSSGAVAAGCQKLGWRRRPEAVHE